MTMKQAIKNKIIKAYELGAGSAMEKKLMAQGLILLTEDGYELFSQEAVNGTGQKARKGDFFKVDGSGYPYPNERKWFFDHHRHLQDDDYQQIGEPLYIWRYGDEVSEELLFLLKTEKLHLNNEDSERYFEAFLWGSLLNAPRDSTLVFYSVDRDDNGKITDISFNFVAKQEFERDYQMV